MLINLRNALMTGKRLPYDAEVEYLESTGTQYIDTLVNAASNLSVEITMANAGTPWTNVNPVGVILATPRCRHHLNFSSTLHNGVNYCFGNGDSCIVTSGYRPADGEVFTFKVDAISKTFTLGSFLGTFPNDTFDTGLSYWLFGRNGTTPPYLGSLRIYSAKLWNGSILVRDFIPVRVGTVGYLYDRVSGKLFGNAGTGDFQYGQDVVPVEWLESDGDQYIDTGIKPDATYTFDSSVAATSDFFNTVYWGCRTSGTYQSENLQCYLNSNTQSNSANKTIRLLSTNSTNVGNWLSGIVPTVDVMYHFEGMTVVPTMNNMAYPLTLFAFNDKGVVNAAVGKCRIGSWVPYSNGEKVANFRSVRVGTDATSWEGAMMDVLTRRIYRNDGTGAFGYGNDLKYPIPSE